MCDGVLRCLLFVFNVFLVSLHGDYSECIQYNGGLLEPRHYTVDPMSFPSGNPFKCREEVLYLQPLIPPKRFDISPPLKLGDAQKV